MPDSTVCLKRQLPAGRSPGCPAATGGRSSLSRPSRAARRYLYIPEKYLRVQHVIIESLSTCHDAIRAFRTASCTSCDCTRVESGTAHKIYSQVMCCLADETNSVFWDSVLWWRYREGLSPVRPVRLEGVIGRLEGRYLPVVWRRSSHIPIAGKCGGASYPIDGKSFLCVLIRPRPVGAIGLQITAIFRVLQCIRRRLCLRLNVPSKIPSAPASDDMSLNTHFYHMLRRPARNGRLSQNPQTRSLCTFLQDFTFLGLPPPGQQALEEVHPCAQPPS